MLHTQKNVAQGFQPIRKGGTCSFSGDRADNKKEETKESSGGNGGVDMVLTVAGLKHTFLGIVSINLKQVHDSAVEPQPDKKGTEVALPATLSNPTNEVILPIFWTPGVCVFW